MADNRKMTNKQEEQTSISASSPLRVGIIGGGVAGTTIAIRLAALGVQTYLFESKSSLIDGPPMCHLHAGGNLYRGIPDDDCVELLKQSIDMLRLYPYSIDVRPTIIAVPKRDKGNPEDLIPRLDLLTRVYQDMVDACPDNQVLGDPQDYYRLYDRQTLEYLAKLPVKTVDSEFYSTDDWVANAAKTMDLDKLQYPVVAVMEYGWNIFRLAASAQTALNDYANAHVLLDTQVTEVVALPLSDCDNLNNTTPINQWQINYKSIDESSGSLLSEEVATPQSIHVDYLVNACGFRTGVIDNMVGIPAKRMVEFKASYIAHWADLTHKSYDESITNLPLPEIIFHGERGTPQGMVQLTPYPNGYYQIHSMDKEVTLFNDGLVSTADDDAQPQLNSTYLEYIDQGWDEDTLIKRSQKAIQQVSEFVPKFATAKPTQNALYGGQQIPGENDTLRVADVSLYGDMRYARAENVKASSALLAADDVVNELVDKGLFTTTTRDEQMRVNHQWLYLSHITKQDIDNDALLLTEQRHFPRAMSDVVNPYKVSTL